MGAHVRCGQSRPGGSAGFFVRTGGGASLPARRLGARIQPAEMAHECLPPSPAAAGDTAAGLPSSRRAAQRPGGAAEPKRINSLRSPPSGGDRPSGGCSRIRSQGRGPQPACSHSGFRLPLYFPDLIFRFASGRARRAVPPLHQRFSFMQNHLRSST